MRLISVPTKFHVGLFYYSNNYFSAELEALNELEANNRGSLGKNQKAPVFKVLQKASVWLRNMWQHVQVDVPHGQSSAKNTLLQQQQ